MVCTAFRRVVVETWVDCWAVEFSILEPPIDEAIEYMDIRLSAAMVGIIRESSLSTRCCFKAARSERGDSLAARGLLEVVESLPVKGCSVG